MVSIIRKKIYKRIFGIPSKVKKDLFLETCKRLSIAVPSSLDLSLQEVLIPHHLTVKQFAGRAEVGERVLDMGCGLGILSVIAFKKGAKEVVAADINPAALRETKKFVPEATTVQSDLFENVNGVYDTILFNAPWIDGVVQKPIEYAWCDCNDVAGRFFSDARRHLKEKGSIWFQYADAFPKKHQRLQSLIKENGFKVINRWHHTRWGVAVNRFIREYLYKIKAHG